MLLFINDGFCIDHVIKAKGKYPALKFTYRPALAIETLEHRMKYNQAKSSSEKILAESRFVLSHLVSWDAVDADGKTVQATEELLSKLHESYRDDMISAIIWGAAAEEESAKN